MTSYNEKHTFVSVSKNPNGITQWFLTFPKSEGVESKESFHTNLPPSFYSLTCSEQHEDGTEHLHMVIKLKKPISKPKMRKWFSEKYPGNDLRIHYGAVKNMDCAIDYCRKEDSSPLEVGTLETSRSRKKKESPEDAAIAVHSEVYSQAICRQAARVIDAKVLAAGQIEIAVRARYEVERLRALELGYTYSLDEYYRDLDSNRIELVDSMSKIANL